MISRFISCDWGTSNFRCRVIDLVKFDILAEVKNDRGIASFDQNNQQSFEDHLRLSLELLDQQLEDALSGEPFYCSGMGSASIGWKELPYAKLPCRIGLSDLKYEKMPAIQYNGNAYEVVLISGLQSDADVMRGEEIELLGVLNREEVKSHWSDCWVILPGTHSKHIKISQDKIIDFHTHMTGELFSLLTKESVLKHSMNTKDLSKVFDEESFSRGVSMVQTHGLSESLFKVRSLSLIEKLGSNVCFNFLSGLLIGNEMNSLHSYDVPIFLSASKSMCQAYAKAAEVLNLKQFHMLASDRHDYLAAEGQSLFIKK